MRNMIAGLGIGLALGVFVSLTAFDAQRGGFPWFYGLVVVGILVSLVLSLLRVRRTEASKGPRPSRQAESSHSAP